MRDLDDRFEFLIALAYTLTATASLTGETVIAGFDLLTPIVSFWEMQLDYATLGSLLSLMVVWFYNRPSIENMDTAYQAIVAGTVGLTVWGSYKPAFGSSWELPIQILLVSVSIAGYWALAHH